MKKRFAACFILMLAAAILFTACGSGGGALPLGTGNSAPVANAGADRTVLTGDPVTLDGSQSTVGQGSTLTYAWNIDSGPASNTAVLNDTTVVNPTFTPDVDGDYVISLIVNDTVADSAVDTVTITASSTPSAADTLDLSIDGGSNTTYTETYVTVSNSPNGFDPMIHGYYDTGNAATGVLLLSGSDGVSAWDEMLTLVIPSNTVGTYTLAQEASIIYTPVNVLNSYVFDNGDYTSVSITISQYDAVGGRIKGTFTSTLCLLVSGDCSIPGNLKTFVGSFDVTREPNI